MTPEERAEDVLRQLDGCLGCSDPDASARLIAEAVRQAVEDERVACARVVEAEADRLCDYGDGYDRLIVHSLCSVASAIRKGGGA